MPYGCHGRPQWNLPPRYSNVIQCMWPSTRPPTRPNDVLPFAGVPVASSEASGYTAQPLAGTNLIRPASPADAESAREPAPFGPTLSTRPSTDCGVSVKKSPPAGSTRQSAAGLGSLAELTLPSSCAVRNVLSGR